MEICEREMERGVVERRERRNKCMKENSHGKNREVRTNKEGKGCCTNRVIKSYVNLESSCC